MSKLSQVINRSRSLSLDAAGSTPRATNADPHPHLDLAKPDPNKAPIILWNPPAEVDYQPGGFRLTDAHLDAVSNPSGIALTFNPPSGTRLEARDEPYQLKAFPVDRTKYPDGPVKVVTLKVNKAKATVALKEPKEVDYLPGGFVLSEKEFLIDMEPKGLVLDYDPPLGTKFDANPEAYPLKVCLKKDDPANKNYCIEGEFSKPVTLKVNKAKAIVTLKEPNAVDYVAGGFVLCKEHFIIENLEPKILVLDYEPPLGTKLDVKKGGYSLRVSLKKDDPANKNYCIEGEFSKPVILLVKPLKIAITCTNPIVVETTGESVFKLTEKHLIATTKPKIDGLKLCYSAKIGDEFKPGNSKLEVTLPDSATNYVANPFPLTLKVNESSKDKESREKKAREAMGLALAPTEAVLKQLPPTGLELVWDGMAWNKKVTSLKDRALKVFVLKDLLIEVKDLEDKATKFLQICTTCQPGATLALDTKFAVVWEDREKEKNSAKSASTKQDDAAFKQAMEQIAKLGHDRQAAESIWAQVKNQAENLIASAGTTQTKLKKDASVDCGAINRRITKLLQDICGTTGVLILSLDTRDKIASDAQKLESWDTNVKTCVLSDNVMILDLKQADDVGGSDRKKFKAEYLKLTAAINDPDATSGAIGSAYTDLLKLPGPWTQRLNAGLNAGQALADATNYLTDIGCGAPQINTLAPLLAARNGAVQVLLSAPITKLTLEALLTACGNDIVMVLTWVQKCGNNDARCLSAATDYLPFLDVSGANFAQLVQRNQVDLVSGGYNNPFSYWCTNHGMHEAEAKLDVCWKGDISGKTIWGVVHVHYHRKTTTDPDPATYYHVKAGGNFSPSLGAKGKVNDNAAKGAINNKIPAGQTF